jgi:hypothetical protein
VLGEVANGLVYHAQWFMNPGTDDLNGERRKAVDDLRRIGCDLLSKSHAVPVYGVWEIFRVVPKWKNVLGAQSQLIFLSNSTFRGDPSKNQDAVTAIKSALGIRF